MAKHVIQALLARFPDAVTDAYEGVGGDDCAFVKRERIHDVCKFLKLDPAMDFKMSPYITAVDYLGLEPRFEIIYQLYSTSKNHRARLRVKVAEGEHVPSVTPVWR